MPSRPCSHHFRNLHRAVGGKALSPTCVGWRAPAFGRQVNLPTAALILMAVAPSALFAQWPSYPTPGVPRTPDGKPNLSAPAPKTLDGKPDLTGIWETARAPATDAAMRVVRERPSMATVIAPIRRGACDNRSPAIRKKRSGQRFHAASSSSRTRDGIQRRRRHALCGRRSGAS